MLNEKWFNGWTEFAENRISNILIFCFPYLPNTWNYYVDRDDKGRFYFLLYVESSGTISKCEVYKMCNLAWGS